MYSILCLFQRVYELLKKNAIVFNSLTFVKILLSLYFCFILIKDLKQIKPYIIEFLLLTTNTQNICLCAIYKMKVCNF